MKKPTLKKLEKLAKVFKNTKTFDYEDFTLEVKQYLPIEEKKALVADVALRCIAEDNGLQIIHTYISHIVKSTSIIRYYTNIELPKDNFEAYNLLNKLDIYKQALSMIPQSELDEINMMIDKLIEDLKFNQMYSSNVKTVVSQVLNKLVDKLPSSEEAEKFIEDASKEIKEFDPNKVKFVQDFLKANSGEKIDG
mgnify:CR=1 FL=1